MYYVCIRLPSSPCCVQLSGPGTRQRSRLPPREPQIRVAFVWERSENPSQDPRATALLSTSFLPPPRTEIKMEGAVRRWLVDISQWDPSPAQFSFLLSLLPKHEQPAIIRFIQLDDRKRALVSRLLQYSLVHEVLGIPHDEININRTTEGRPYLNTSGQNFSYPNFNFSVSHSGNYVGIASEPLCIVGLDIVSDVLGGESSLKSINSFSSYFTCMEWKNIIDAGSSNHVLAEFYRYWSLKEAYVKALGIGLGYKLNRLEFRHIGWSDISVYIDGEESRDWKFWHFDLDEKHLVSIARGHPGGATESFRHTLVQTDLKDEEYSSAFALPNPHFILRRVDQLIPPSAARD